MKQLIVCLIGMMMISAGYAQMPKGGRQQMDPQKMSERTAEKISTELGLSKAKKDSVQIIFYSFYVNVKEVGRANSEMIKVLEYERDLKMERLLTAEQYNEYLKIMEEMKKRRASGPQGPNGPGGRRF